MLETPVFKFALREDLKEHKEFLPTRAEPKATGWDVRAAQEDRKSLIIQPFEYVKIPLGFRAFCPEGWWYELRPRSSSFAKKHIHALYGVVDQCFENFAIFSGNYVPFFKIKTEEKFNTDYSSKLKSKIKAEPLVIEFGEAIGQIIPVKRKEMNIEQISNEEYDLMCAERNSVRKTGGFGSTSK